VTPDRDPAAGQPGDPAADDQPTAPPATDEPAVAPTGGPVERRGDDEELQATDVIGLAQSATEDGFGVGEGVSRPFVYETPGPVQGNRGSRRRQPGQVRLRRCLVTEVVTETETGQRHELQVEREPIDDTDVADRNHAFRPVGPAGR
jgi:hypothetical protein